MGQEQERQKEEIKRLSGAMKQLSDGARMKTECREHREGVEKSLTTFSDQIRMDRAEFRAVLDSALKDFKEVMLVDIQANQKAVCRGFSELKELFSHMDSRIEQDRTDIREFRESMLYKLGRIEQRGEKIN